jgi:hypothetical protein
MSKKSWIKVFVVAVLVVFIGFEISLSFEWIDSPPPLHIRIWMLVSTLFFAGIAFQAPYLYKK